MKKTLLFALALLLSVTMFAQNRAGYISQHFDGETMPSGWTISGLGTGNWSIAQSNQAGGEANELTLYWSPQFNGISRVVSPAIDLTNAQELVVSFKHYLDNYSGSNAIGVATSSDGTTWNTAWEKSYSATGQYTVNEIITTPDMGKNNVYFCLYFNGDAYNINNWYFDDIEVFSQENLDLKLASIDVAGMKGAGNTDITFTVQNIGKTAIETFEATFNSGIEGDSDITETFTANLEPMASKQFTFSEKVFYNPGAYNLPISINKVNDVEDDDAANNELEKEVLVALGETQRTVMIEHFSSSTCGPCVSVNYAMNQLTAANPGKFTYAKYQMNWPGSGDAYYTEEGGTRRNYYGVNAVPMLFFDGQNVNSGNQTTLDQYYNKAAFADVRGSFTIEGSTINIIADFMSYVQMDNVRAFVVVNEKETTGNVGSNGETSFHHVMMKMLDGANGNQIAINAGEYKRVEFSFNMASTHVEDMNDLEVALWLQDFSTKEMYNSHFAYEYTDHVYPVQNHTMTADGNDLVVTWEAPEAGTPTGYMVKVNGEVKEENTTNMSYTIANAEGLNIAEVIALYGDKSSVPTISSSAAGNDETPCEAPTNLNATVDVDAYDFDHTYKVTLTWDAADNANEYVVYLDGEILTTTTDLACITGFNEMGSHYFTVASVCENGESEQSEPFNFEVTSIEEINNSFVIYPNPVKDVVMIQGNSINEISVYNSVGVLVERIEVAGSEVEINMNDYNTGIYFVQVNTENGTATRKVVKL